MLKVERRKAQGKKAGWERRREEVAPGRGRGRGLHAQGTRAYLGSFLPQASWEVMGGPGTTEPHTGLCFRECVLIPSVGNGPEALRALGIQE